MALRLVLAEVVTQVLAQVHRVTQVAVVVLVLALICLGGELP